jgi:hypothetical protein
VVRAIRGSKTASHYPDGITKRTSSQWDEAAEKAKNQDHQPVVKRTEQYLCQDWLMAQGHTHNAEAAMLRGPKRLKLIVVTFLRSANHASQFGEGRYSIFAGHSVGEAEQTDRKHDCIPIGR